MNYIRIMFTFASLVIFSCGTLINTLEKHLPVVVVKTFRYGKFAYKKDIPKGLLSMVVIDVPKYWFQHFYRSAILIFAYLLYITTCTYIFDKDVPQWLNNFIDLVCSKDRVAHTCATRTYLAVVLLNLQVFRRFYDTHFVSIYGRNSYINFPQYLCGLFHYPGCVLALLCEASKFAPNSSTARSTFDFTAITSMDFFAVIIFIWAWWHQHVTTKILANLRKNGKGTVVTHDHKLPHGDWFKYLSSPPQIAEILMYFSLTILLWHNKTWLFVFVWVLSNQVETILLGHWWYKETFDNFPKDRKALIPFLY